MEIRGLRKAASKWRPGYSLVEVGKDHPFKYDPVNLIEKDFLLADQLFITIFCQAQLPGLVSFLRDSGPHSGFLVL